MRILLLASAFNGLTQRIRGELLERGHQVSVELAIDAPTMEEAAALFAPDLIVCPFLKQRIPDSVWKKHVCLVVHPGIEGDRGPSSLDWAIMGRDSGWGVTLLQAAEQMDAGDIWGAAEFPLRAAPKASVYRREVTEHAVRLVLRATEDHQDRSFKPRRLDYGNVHVTGRWNRPMKQADRAIDWRADSTDAILAKLNAAESAPGVLDRIGAHAFHLFDPRRAIGITGKPGELIARHYDAVCRATIDGAIWIGHLKAAEPKSIKLPALRALPSAYSGLRAFDTDALDSKDLGCNEIRYREDGPVGYLYFDFYNGAMNTEQCDRLRRALLRVKQRAVKVVVLMGGEEFWSNGIHLSCIEAADNPAEESWRNINAINDLVREILATDKQLTVAALRTNAGAGGAVLAAACDYVLMRRGVVLNVHYKSMGLYGSEYWTYVLPRRIGSTHAIRLTDACLPTLATEAHAIGFADHVLGESWTEYHAELESICRALAARAPWKKQIAIKKKLRAQDEKARPLQAYRDDELRHMHAMFFNKQSEFHRARHDFVFKTPPARTPLRIALHRAASSPRRSSAA